MEQAPIANQSDRNKVLNRLCIEVIGSDLYGNPSSQNGFQINSSIQSNLFSSLLQYYSTIGPQSQWNHELMNAFNYGNQMSQNLQCAYPI